MALGFKIALAQISMDEHPQVNLDKTLACMDRAAAQSADLILFPESQFSPYFPQYPRQDASRYLATLDSPLVRAMQDRCRARRLIATANVYLAEGGKKYSATLVINRDGEILGCSKKVHITCVPQFYEQHYFTGGDAGFGVYDTDLGKIGVVICYDRHYPESMRACALRGAELVLVPTANTLAENMEMFEWEMRVAAFQNSLYIAMCNRVGVEGEMRFAGESLVIDPDGNLLVKGSCEEEMLYARLDRQLVQHSREARPYLRLRHPHLTATLKGFEEKNDARPPR